MIARECGNGSRPCGCQIIAAFVFEMQFDARQSPCITRQLRPGIAEAAVIHAQAVSADRTAGQVFTQVLIAGQRNRRA